MSVDPERKISEALRAHSRGGAVRSARAWTAEAPGALSQAGTALVLALLGGAVLGAGLALLSLLAPGLLPALG